MKLFSRKEVNTGRQFEFDLAKAICILGMVFVHCFEELPLASNGYNGSLYYFFVIVLDAIFGAGTFMICLGVGLTFTRKNAPNDFIKRGIVTFLLGYVLNIFRFVIPYLPFAILGYIDLLDCFLYTDIMQFAGLSFLLYGVLKKIKVPDWGIAILAIAMSVVGWFIRAIYVENIYLSELLGLFIGTYTPLPEEDYFAVFPLINWFIIVVFGYFFGKLIRRTQNTEKFYAISTPISGIIVILYMCLAIPNRYGMMSGELLDYFQMSSWEAIIIMMGAIFAFGLYHYISKLFNVKIKAFITRLSSNINKTYCIHWIIVGWLIALLWPFYTTGIRTYAVILIAIFTYAISTFLAEVVKRRSEKKKAMKNATKNKIDSNDYSLSFITLLKKRAQESKNAAAFVFKDKSYSWKDVDLGSSIVAKELENIGVKRGTHVGICGTNSINWIFTFFGILKLGGIAVLINPSLKPTEITNICKIGGVSTLCYSEIEGVTSFDSYKNICLDQKQIKAMFNFSSNIDFIQEFAGIFKNNSDFKDEFQSDDACLIIYTSGSTSKPKAVLTSAYSIMYSIKHTFENYHYTKDDTVLAFLPFFHVFGLISSIAAGLLIGCKSVIPASKSPKELIELIDKYKVTLFNTVPTMMLAIINSEDFDPEKLSSLKSTVLGGSTTTKEQMIMLRKLFPNNHFGNIYGMSENAAISITGFEDTTEHITETVGKPVEGTMVVIKDNNGNQVPQGTVGEICIKSLGMLVWYYKLPLDMQPIDDEGFFKTGDLGYIDQDGYIRLTGRIKELIISGGENISPNEVSEAIASLKHFRQIQVVGVPDKIKGEVVAAALILKKGHVFDENEVRNELSKILAKYKLPVYYKIFKSFPLLGTEKIDKLSIIKQISEEYNL